MDCSIQIIILCLHFADAFLIGARPLKNVSLALEQQSMGYFANDSKLKDFSLNATVLDAIEESVVKFIIAVELHLKEIDKEKLYFFQNLQDEQISKMEHITNCLQSYQLENLKTSFIIRLNLLEVPIRKGITELHDKINEIKRTVGLKRSLLELKLNVCEILDYDGHCSNISILQEPCLNNTCVSPQMRTDFIQFPSRVSTTQKYRRNLLSTECENGDFRCVNGNCIPHYFVCESTPACSDASDSIPCEELYCPLRCRNKKCITEEHICNGLDDCGDGTDEENCHNEDDCGQDNGTFLCPDRKICLPLSALCDSSPDCNGGADEAGMCGLTDGCGSCFTLGGACVRTPSGPQCLSDCPSSMALDLVSGVCVAVDTPSGKRLIFKDYSVIGVIGKIDTLLNRLVQGMPLLKKHVNMELSKMVQGCNIKAQPFNIIG